MQSFLKPHTGHKSSIIIRLSEKGANSNMKKYIFNKNRLLIDISRSPVYSKEEKRLMFEYFLQDWSWPSQCHGKECAMNKKGFLEIVIDIAHYRIAKEWCECRDE